jgi:hypothetical protein
MMQAWADYLGTYSAWWNDSSIPRHCRVEHQRQGAGMRARSLPKFGALKRLWRASSRQRSQVSSRKPRPPRREHEFRLGAPILHPHRDGSDVLRGGMAAWIAEGEPQAHLAQAAVSELQKALVGPAKPVLLNVQSPRERKSGISMRRSKFHTAAWSSCQCALRDRSSLISVIGTSAGRRPHIRRNGSRYPRRALSRDCHYRRRDCGAFLSTDAPTKRIAVIFGAFSATRRRCQCGRSRRCSTTKCRTGSPAGFA